MTKLTVNAVFEYLYLVTEKINKIEIIAKSEPITPENIDLTLLL